MSSMFHKRNMLRTFLGTEKWSEGKILKYRTVTLIENKCCEKKHFIHLSLYSLSCYFETGFQMFNELNMHDKTADTNRK